jgi:hypothetical protein
LHGALNTIAKRQQDRPDLILAAWPMMVGSRLSGMSRAVSFEEGVLMVVVNNSTLYALLQGTEKARLTRELQSRFPDVEIRAIHFRVG